MQIPESRLENIDQLHKYFRIYRSHSGFGYIFRGQADVSWGLFPRAGRPEYYLNGHRDLGRFNEWSKFATAYIKLPESALEQLAIAQHHGLATRLLDWTLNPLVACYFACNLNFNLDGAIYVLEPGENYMDESTTFDHLIQLNGVYCYVPKAIFPRLINQKGSFTIHCDAKKEIELQESTIDEGSKNILKIVIPAKLKKDVLNHIKDYGIDNTFLFPDLDGLSIDVNEDTKNMRGGILDL